MTRRSSSATCGTPDSGYVGVDERPLQLPGPDADRIVTRVGEAIIVHDASLQEQPELDEVVHAARIALERGLSLRSLEESERRARAVLDAIPDNVYRVSIDGTFLEPSSLAGRRIDEVLPEISDVVMAGVRRALAANEVVSVEYQFTEPNGVRDHEARIVRSGEDEVVGIVRDVTEQKEAGGRPSPARRGAGGSEPRRGDRRDRDGAAAGLRRRDRGGCSPPGCRRRESRALHANPGAGGHRRQVERAGRADSGFRHGRHPGRQRALQGRANGRAGANGHGRPRRCAGAPRTAHRARRDLSRRRADRRVGGHLGRRRRLGDGRRAVRAERGGANREVREPRRGGARERSGPGGARAPWPTSRQRSVASRSPSPPRRRQGASSTS